VTVQVRDRISLYWCDDQKWFDGVVTKIKGHEHQIQYDDGDLEYEDLACMQWKAL
jgi:hypothetical protein